MRRRIHVIGGGGYMSYEEEDTWKAAYTPLSHPSPPTKKKKGYANTESSIHPPLPTPHPLPPPLTLELGEISLIVKGVPPLTHALKTPVALFSSMFTTSL